MLELVFCVVLSHHSIDVVYLYSRLSLFSWLPTNLYQLRCTYIVWKLLNCVFQVDRRSIDHNNANRIQTQYKVYTMLLYLVLLWAFSVKIDLHESRN